MDKHIHVYCTECQFGEELINEIGKDEETIVPQQCKGCFPYNPDSFYLP